METKIINKTAQQIMKVMSFCMLLFLFQPLHAECPLQSPGFTTTVSGNSVSIALSGSGYNSYIIGYGDQTYTTDLTHTYVSTGTKTICVKFQFVDSFNTSNHCDTTICITVTIENTTAFDCPINEPNFTASITGNIVSLTKTGSGYTNYYWTYGDGTTGTSNTHTYTTAGVKTICLKYYYVDSTNTSRHCDSTICKNITINNNFTCPIQGIYFAVLVDGNSIKLTKYGTGYTSYQWNYGDGTTGTDSLHTYTTGGQKSICLKYTFNTPNGTCDTTYCKTITITLPFVCPIREPNFTASVSGNTVTLTNTGSGYNYYLWNYGDGTTGTSSTHTYAANQNYQTFTVCLKFYYVDTTNTSRHCDTTVCQTITIPPALTTCPIRHADFTATVNGNTVTLTTSGDGYNSYLVNYGDGTTGTSNTHTYTTPGTKTICINFRYSNGTNTTLVCDTTVCKTITIEPSNFVCPIQGIYFSVLIDGNTVNLTKYGTGYTFYQWNYGDGTIGTSNSHTYTTPGVKTICLKYIYVDSTNTSRHCDTSFCKTITITTPAFNCHLQNVNFNTEIHNDTIFLIKAGSGYNSYIWSYGDGYYGTENHHIYNSNGIKYICIKFTDSSANGTCDTIICKTVTISGACDSVSCVLPGDADHDFTVNNFDIFAIGLSYNRTGLARPNATTQYNLQPAPDWPTNSYYVFNDKFVDCNGNGVINNADGSVILQNYIAKPDNQFNHRVGNLDSLPPVYLAFDSLPIFQIGNPCNTTELVSDINVGSSDQIAENVYGIGFSVEYPANFSTDSCFKILVDLDANSWFSDNEPILYLVKNLPQFNRVDIGISRTTGTTRSGNGRIGKIKFVVEDGIFIYGRLSSNKQYTFTVSNVAGVDNRGNSISFVGLPSDATFIVSGLKNNIIEGLKVYPNPTNNNFFVSAGEIIQSLTIYDIAGQIIKAIDVNDYQKNVDISDISGGMYLMEIKSKNVVNTIKLIKSK